MGNLPERRGDGALCTGWLCLSDRRHLLFAEVRDSSFVQEWEERSGEGVQSQG